MKSWLLLPLVPLCAQHYHVLHRRIGAAGFALISTTQDERSVSWHYFRKSDRAQIEIGINKHETIAQRDGAVKVARLAAKGEMPAGSLTGRPLGEASYAYSFPKYKRVMVAERNWLVSVYAFDLRDTKANKQWVEGIARLALAESIAGEATSSGRYERIDTRPGFLGGRWVGATTYEARFSGGFVTVELGSRVAKVNGKKITLRSAVGLLNDLPAIAKEDLR